MKHSFSFIKPILFFVLFSCGQGHHNLSDRTRVNTAHERACSPLPSGQRSASCERDYKKREEKIATRPSKSSSATPTKSTTTASGNMEKKEKEEAKEDVKEEKPPPQTTEPIKEQPRQETPSTIRRAKIEIGEKNVEVAKFITERLKQKIKNCSNRSEENQECRLYSEFKKGYECFYEKNDFLFSGKKKRVNTSDYPYKGYIQDEYSSRENSSWNGCSNQVIAHITKARYTQQDYQVQEGAAVNCVTFVFAVLQKSIRDLFDLHFHSSWQVLLKQFLCSKESNSYACYKRTERSPKMRGHYCMQSVIKEAKGGKKIIELARTGDILVRFNPKTYSPSHIGLIEKIDTERKQVFAYHATNPYRGVVLDSYTEKQLQNYGIIRSNQKFLDHLKILPATSYDSPQEYEKVCEQFMEREGNI